jgi:hypothetical protein
MTIDEDERPLGAGATRYDTSSQRALFSYLTANVAEEYLAIMRLFTGTLLADLSAADVAAQLAEQGLALDPDTVENRCRQLVD